MVAAGQPISAADFPGIQSWNPAIGQGGATNIAKTLHEGSYVINQDWLTGSFHATLTGTGSASNQITIGLPVDPAYAGPVVLGLGWFLDASTGAYYQISWYRSATSQGGAFRAAHEGTTPFLGVSGFTAALASSDQLSAHVSYRVA